MHLYAGNRIRPKVIRGTFLSGDELKDGIYLVLYQDGRYAKYRQFQIIKHGTFEHRADDNYIFIFYDEDGQFSAQAIYFRFNDIIYFINEDGEIMVFNRISNVPTYVNVESLF